MPTLETLALTDAAQHVLAHRRDADAFERVRVLAVQLATVSAAEVREVFAAVVGSPMRATKGATIERLKCWLDSIVLSAHQSSFCFSGW